MQVTDQVTLRIQNFWLAHGPRLIANVRELSTRFSGSNIHMPFHPISDSSERVQRQIDIVMELIENLCTGHNFTRLLTLFRKVPHQIVIDIFRGSSQTKREENARFAAIYPEAVLFGTNCILKFCCHKPSLRSNNERYTFTPTEKELEDAIRLLLLSTVHRYELFYMNSIIRSNLVEPVALDLLLDIYNQRLRRRWAPKPLEPESDAIILPGLIHQVPHRDRKLRFRTSSGTELALMAWNYLPKAVAAEPEFKQFGYLDTDDFQRYTGVSFSVFQKVWLGLNELLIHHLPMFWSEAWRTATKAEVLTARVIQADDYCESALGGGYPKSIWKSCHELLTKKYTVTCPTETECRDVVALLTYSKFEGDVRFVEQPFVFYYAGDRLLFWDYFRHAGLLRCLARNLSRQPNTAATQNKKGEILEQAVMSAVSEVPGVGCVRKWILRGGGRDIWDVDIGFVYRGILFLIDAKNEQKNVRYYFEGVEVADKVLKRGRFLEKLDRYLATYAAQVHSAWTDCQPILGAICLVCTTEAEFIPSADPAMWLQFPECPRICMLSELLTFMEQHSAVDELAQHPGFFHFGKG